MNNGKMFVVVGTTRSGKSVFTKTETAKIKRQLIWDAVGDYPCDFRARHQSELLALIENPNNLQKRIAYTGRLSDFSFFCKLAFTWLKIGAATSTRGALIFEETADVTSPAKAPENYGIILRRGLRYGSDIYAITQRPAESDKTSFGNASVIHCCRLHYENDCKYMAQTLKVPKADIENLVASTDLNRFDFIQRDMTKQEVRHGVLSFTPSGRAKYSYKSR